MKTKTFRWLSCAILTMFALLAQLDLMAGDKIALVVGNSNYARNVSLPTCVADANAMSSCLERLGYEVILLKNADHKAMSAGVSRLKEKLERGNYTDAVFFFSGHGVASETRQYLIVSGAVNARGGDFSENDKFSIQDLKADMKKYCARSYVFIDACRTRDITLKNVEKTYKGQLPPGVDDGSSGNMQWVFYAAPWGHPASTAGAGLSPFTESLTEHLFDMDSFNNVWDRIVHDVEKANGGDCTPQMAGPMGNGGLDRVCFNPDGIGRIKRRVAFHVAPAAKIDIAGALRKPGEWISLQVGSSTKYTIKLEGYKPYCGEIKVTDGLKDSTVYAIKLEKIYKAKIRVTSVPKGADVYLDKVLQGKTPLDIVSTNGSHGIRITTSGHGQYSEEIDLVPGENKPLNVVLKREPGEFFKWSEDGGAGFINYHYSPKYQLGVDYMHRFECSRFSLGGLVAVSGGFLKGLFSGTEVSQSVSIVAPGKDTEKSEEFSVSDEYDANALLLGNLGFNVCNGIMIEAGFGAAFHQKHYTLESTSTSAIITSYNSSNCYKGASEWSPAMRLGTKFFIPLDGWYKYFLVAGGGYTYLPMNHNFSSWDASIGICWYL